jgi:hypothetical protein
MRDERGGMKDERENFRALSRMILTHHKGDF